jgi:hypothetical protein
VCIVYCFAATFLSLFALIYCSTTATVLNDLLQMLGKEGDSLLLPLPVCMPFLAEQAAAPNVYSHVQLAFYNCLLLPPPLSPAASGSAALAGKVHWDSIDATKLAHIAANSSDVLATTQSLLTAMV